MRFETLLEVTTASGTTRNTVRGTRATDRRGYTSGASEASAGENVGDETTILKKPLDDASLAAQLLMPRGPRQVYLCAGMLLCTALANKGH